MKKPLLWAVLLCLALSGCARPLSREPDLARTSKLFSEAMRWRDFRNAADLLRPDLREQFLRQFDDDDLRIVESRILSVRIDEKQQTAETEYRLQYYRLPSTRIRTWRWIQPWVYLDGAESEKGWRLDDGPPEFE